MQGRIPPTEKELDESFNIYVFVLGISLWNYYDDDDDDAFHLGRHSRRRHHRSPFTIAGAEAAGFL